MPHQCIYRSSPESCTITVLLPESLDTVGILPLQLFFYPKKISPVTFIQVTILNLFKIIYIWLFLFLNINIDLKYLYLLYTPLLIKILPFSYFFIIYFIYGKNKIRSQYAILITFPLIYLFYKILKYPSFLF